MKFGCSLEMVHMRTSGPNFIIRQSKGYWVEMFKLVAAAGFKGIELPYNPYTSDPIAFEVGRCGMPISQFAVNAKFGSSQAFMEMLRSFGIEEVTGVHINPNDIMLELLAREASADAYFPMLQELADDAMSFLISLGSKCLVMTPTPEIGLLAESFGGGKDGWQPDFVDRTIQAINAIATRAKAKGLTLAVKNEFWSMGHGPHLQELFAGLDADVRYSPDAAHLVIGGADPVLTVRSFSGRMAAVRFNDTSFVDAENNFRRINPEIPVTGAQRVFADLGEGTVDLKGMHEALKESGYVGWVICESRNTLNVHRALLKMRWFIDHELKA